MDQYATSFSTVPEPCAILGTSLRPFCLGHHLLFKRLGLPFCGNPLATADWAELQIGIAICGQGWCESHEQFLTGQWASVFARWVRDLRGPWYRRRKIGKTDLFNAEVLFRAYLSDGYKRAPVWELEDDKEAISISAPWELVLKNKLVQNGHAEGDVLRKYLPATWYDYYTVSELNAAKVCTDPKKWKRVFFTLEDYEAIEAAKKEGGQDVTTS